MWSAFSEETKASAALNAADALRYAPGYLSYFTPFVRPAESFRLLTDSNLDWGQGLLSLRDYQRDHPGELPAALTGRGKPGLLDDVRPSQLGHA